MTRCDIRTELSSLDLDLVCDFIQQSYWGRRAIGAAELLGQQSYWGRSSRRILETFKNSLCFGAFREGRQVGFA